MASSRWALRAAVTLTALAVALPFSSGTASAESDPLFVLLQDNNVNLTVGVSGNVDMIPVAASAQVGIGDDVGAAPAMDVMANGGIQVALGLAAHVDEAVDAHVSAMAEVGKAPAAAPPAAPAVAAPPAPALAAAEVAEPAVAPPPTPAAAPEPAAPVLEEAVTVTDDTVAVADEPKGDEEEEDCPEEVRPSGCPNITALGILSVCLLPDLVQLHI